MTLKEILFVLLRAEICGQELPEGLQEELTVGVLEKLYSLSKAQDLVHLLGDVLLKRDLLLSHKELSQKFNRQQRMAIYRREQLNYELERICTLLNEIKVVHMPLKGSVLQAD